MTSTPISLSSKAGFGFWCQWTCVTVTGFLLSLYWVEIGFKPEVSALQGAIGGAVIGIAQWFVLRQKLSHAWMWAVMSAVGWGILGFSHIGVIGWTAPRTSAISIRFLYGTSHGIQAGIIIGLAQWLVLRRQISKAQWWILASGFSWAIGLTYGWVIGGLLALNMKIFLAEVIGLAASWAGVAVITGMQMAILLNQNFCQISHPHSCKYSDSQYSDSQYSDRFNSP